MLASQITENRALLQPTIESINILLELHDISIWLVDEFSMMLEKATLLQGLNEEYIEYSHIPVEKSHYAKQVIDNGQTVIVEDIKTDNNWIQKKGLDSLHVKSAILTPLQIKSNNIGILELFVSENQFFDFKKHEPIIKKFADQIAAAIRQIRGLSKLNEVNRLISSELQNSQLLFDRIMQSAQQVLKCKHVSLFLADYQIKRLNLAATSSPGGIKRKYFNFGEGLAGEVIKAEKPMLVTNVNEHPKYVAGKTAPNAKEKSMLIVPIQIGDKTKGIISADIDTLSGFDNYDQSLLESLASQAAVAIENTNLYQKERNKSAALSELNQISQRLILIKENIVSKDLLQTIAESALKVLGADQIELYEYEDYQEAYKLPQISAGKRIGTKVRKDNILVDDTVAQLINSPKPIYQNDAQAEDSIFTAQYTQRRPDLPKERFVIREKIKSVAAVPLRAENRSLGFMFANFRTEQTFAEAQKELIELFAKQAAIAIKNARLNQRLTQLVETGHKLTSRPRMSEAAILELVKEEAGKVMDTRNMFLALYDEATNTLDFKLVYRDNERYKETETLWANRSAGKGKSEWIIRNKKPLLFHNMMDIEGWYNKPGRQKPEGTKPWSSWLGVPMMVENKVFGVITVRNDVKEHAFDEDDLKVLSSIANQIAIAVDSSRLIERLSNVNKRQKALIEIGQELTSGIRLREDEVLGIIYKKTSDLLDRQNLSIALYDETKDTIRFALASVNGRRIEVESEKGWEPRRSGNGKTEEIIESKKHLLFNTQKEVEERGFSPIPGDEKCKEDCPNAWIGVPMIVGKKVVGVIANYHYGQDYFYSEDDVQILQALANQAAIAIDNAHLFYDINLQQTKLVERQNALIEFGSDLSAKIPDGADEIFKFIHQQATQFMDTNNMYIALYNNSSKEISFPLSFKDGKSIIISTRILNENKKGRTEEIIVTGNPILIPTKKESEEWYAQSDKGEFIGDPLASWVGVPMKIHDKTLGVIATYHPTLDYQYSADDQKILQAMADLATIALENSRLYDAELEKELEAAREKINEAEQLILVNSFTMDILHRVPNLVGTIPIRAENIVAELKKQKKITSKDKTIIKQFDGIKNDAKTLMRSVKEWKPLEEFRQRKWEDVSTLLNSALRNLLIPENIELDFQIRYDLPKILCNPKQLYESFLLIIENALQAMKSTKKGKLFINTRLLKIDKKSKKIIITITDNGHGISSEDMPNIFNLYYTTKSKETGSGFGYGLWRAKSIINSLGGIIEAKSKLNQGSTFEISLPVSVNNEGK